MSASVSIKELVYLIEQFGPKLGWSSRYIDLAATTAGAVFRSLDLDERRDVISIGPSVMPSQLEALTSDLRARKLSDSTISTYTATWKRISEIGGAWAVAVEAGQEDQFWDEVEKYRDTRTQRRSTRPSQRSTLTDQSKPQVSVAHPADVDAESLERIEVPVSGGTAIVLLPGKISQADSARVIGALLSEGVDDSL